jgi:hypothetical protein
MCQGLVSNYGGLVACRFFLGVFEAGVFPGKLLLILMRDRQTDYLKVVHTSSACTINVMSYRRGGVSSLAQDWSLALLAVYVHQLL